MKGGQQTPINIPGLNGHFVCLEKVKTKEINLLTRNSSACEITLLAYVILKHVIEGKIEGKMKVKGRRGIRCKQLLDDIKGKRRYFKEEALNLTVQRTCFVRSYGPVIQIRKMIECLTPYVVVTIFETLSSQHFHTHTGSGRAPPFRLSRTVGPTSRKHIAANFECVVKLKKKLLR
jgi:hypothetical protein